MFFVTNQELVNRGLNRILCRVLKYKSGLTRRADTRTESDPKTYGPVDFRCLQRLNRPKLKAESSSVPTRRSFEFARVYL